MTTRTGSNFFLLRILSIFCVLLVSGCSYTYDPPQLTVRYYPEAQKIDLSVELLLTNEFQNAQWADRGFILPLGEALSRNAEAMSRAVFASVVVTRAETSSKARNSDAILTPNMVSAQRTVGATAFSEQITTILLEWTLTDPDGKLIWVDTVQGDGIGLSGNVFTHEAKTQEQAELALTRLFQNSATAISSSPEIRSYARTRRGG